MFQFNETFHLFSQLASEYYRGTVSRKDFTFELKFGLLKFSSASYTVMEGCAGSGECDVRLNSPHLSRSLSEGIELACSSLHAALRLSMNHGFWRILRKHCQLRCYGRLERGPRGATFDISDKVGMGRNQTRRSCGA